MRRRTFVASLAGGAAIAALSAPAHAQAYPGSQVVRIVVPGAPGGALDALARLMAENMTKTLGGTFVVENKPGASGHIGGEFVARAKPDGYTLLFGASTTHVVSPHVMPPLNYKPVDDFQPITLVAKVHNVLVIHPSIPAKDVNELIAYLKANPGKVSFGSTGIGSNLHLGIELFKMMTGTDMIHVPYNSAALHQDLLAARIQLLLDNIPTATQHIRSGGVRALGVASRERQPEIPDVPTIAETLPGYEVGAWGALSAPKGTPPDIVEMVRKAVVMALADPAVREGFLRQSFHPAPMTADETRAFMQAEYAKWGKVVKDASIKVN